ncbi:uncharacterized protein LOC117829592 [Notolabrus celidotus]|uniref:uncharacterized protein LOC117829592 n=1 Tax=Notolabrus celidotus TaxID=1203425 RepID=UPI0014908704|nr:uncharacterized protein LOC117829592 [Notolabrus celidotus]
MCLKAAGSVFLALLVLFPMTVQESSPGCVTYKHRVTCGLKGLSVDFPCSYPRDVQDIQISEWYRSYSREAKPLKQISDYSSRLGYFERGNGNCTLKLKDLKKKDAMTYYFKYIARNETGHHFKCRGHPGVSLNVLDSAVQILVGEHIRGQNVSTVMEGQRITLTCVPTCAANLNSTPGYIWYKNRQQLNDRRENSHLLSLDPISDKDTGSYVCAMMGYEDFPSSAINIRVQKKHINTVSVSARSPTNDSVTTLKPGDDVQTSTDQRKRRQCVSPVYERPNQNFHVTLDVSAMPSEYATMNPVQRCSASETIYENLQLRNLMK